MFFNTVPFLWFLAAFLVLYGFCPARYRHYLLLLGSAVFITVGNYQAALWVLLFTVLNYFLGIFIQRTERPRAVMGMAVAINAMAMVTFKLLNVGVLGLSFYLFSFMSYLVEVYRGAVQAELDPIRFAGFGIFFPKFIQGPITRYSELGGQLDKPRINAANIQKGLEDFTLGFILNILVVGKLGIFFKTAFGFGRNGFIAVQDKISVINNMYLLTAAVICCFPIISIVRKVSDKHFASKAIVSSAAAVAAALLLIVTSIMLVDATTNPFLYFRF